MAQCVDIRRERFSKHDRLLLDTNVALDIAAPLGAPWSDPRRAEDYSAAVGAAVSAGATISISVLSFFEISNTIERQAFRAYHGRWAQGRDLKEYRRIANERNAVIRNVGSTWAELSTFVDVVDARFAGDAVAGILDTMDVRLLDGYDPLILDAARSTNATLVTHDADFATVPNLIVMTANPRMLEPAR